MEITNFNYGFELIRLKKTNYADGNKALVLEFFDPQSNTWEPYAKLSVNIPEIKLKENEFLIKTWKENERIAKYILEELKIFEDTGWRFPTGRVQAEIWRLI